jgi:hypothetical protein
VLLATVVLASVGGSGSGQDQSWPPELHAVQKHIFEKDYPERFLASVYQARIVQLLLTDLDRDGQAEVVALMRPHYRQSAPIVLYRLGKNFEVTRVREGLAPGPLVPVGGAYLDSHTLGEAADLTIAGPGPPDRGNVLAAMLQSGFGGVVEYRSFFHADRRAGAGAYIDMRHADVPGGAQTCARFEFARVEAIAAGAAEPDPTNVYLVAHLGPELWLYQVSAFLADGLLRKTVRVERTPADFVRLATAGPRFLSYQTRSGDVRPLPVGPR